MRSDPALIGAFRKQAAVVLASGDAEAFVQLWAAWKDQADTCRDDLVDVLKELGQDALAEDAADAEAARSARASIEAGEPVVSWESVKGEAGL